MIRKTLATAFAVAVIGASGMMVSTTSSQAGGYYGGYYQPYYGGYGYGHHCFFKKIKVWGHYGYFWKKIYVCH